MKIELLKLRLQYFATDEVVEETDEDKAVTFEDERAFDSAVDKRLNKALSTAKTKWEAEKAVELERAKSEAEELAKLSKDEREKATVEKQRVAFDARERELNEREYRLEAQHQLGKNDLSEAFVDFVIGESVETTQKNITLLKQQFDEAVEASVNQRLAGKVVKLGTNGQSQTKESIMAIKDTAERQRAISENRGLFLK